MATFSVTSPISNGVKTEATKVENSVVTVEKIVEKEVPVIQEKIVEVRVEVEKIVEKPIEIIKEVIKEVRVEVPVIEHKIVEVIKEVPTVVEKEVKVFVDRVIEAPIQRIHTTITKVPNAMWYLVALESLIIVLMAHYLTK